MASSLEDELSCSVCCEVYQDPQLLPCGHSFCRRCLQQHWAASPGRTCPVCRRPSPRKLVANLVLRNTCESYLRERERENDGEVRCSQHGEKMSFYCETDGEVICSRCKNHNHRSHRVQPLAHAVRQLKTQVSTALDAAEDASESEVYSYIQYQAQQTERLIRKDFEQLHRFLREEEERRIAALREEKERKTGNREDRVEQLGPFLWDTLREEEDLELENSMFLQNFDSAPWRSSCVAPDVELDSGALIDVAKHLGNLKYGVWEKMKDLCPRYPVVLDPNTAPANFSVSDDLVCVSKSRRNRRSSISSRRNRIVLGSEGYTGGFHCWDVEVGDSEHWSVGVCDATAARKPVEPLTYRNGFWGLGREGNVCRVLGFENPCQELKKLPRTVRVKLGHHLMYRTVSFFDADDGAMIEGCIRVPDGMKLFPFLVPGENSSGLRVQPDRVAVTVKQKLGLLGRLLDVEEKKAIISISFFVILVLMCILCKK